MLSSVTLDDGAGSPVTLHETTKRALTKVTGLIGISTVRDASRVRPSSHGSINESRYTDGQIVSIEGEVFSTVSVADAISELRLINKALIETLDVGPALLKWTEGVSGKQLQRLVKLASMDEPVLQEGAAVLNYACTLLAEDPRSYAQALTTVVGGTATVTPADTKDMTVTNNGNRRAAVKIRVYGTAKVVSIALVGTTGIITTDASFRSYSTPDYIEFDSWARTATHSALGDYPQAIDPANTVWFDIPPGSWTVRVVYNTVSGAYGGTPHAEAYVRDAYA